MPQKTDAPTYLYQSLGATPGCRRLSSALYAHIARDPRLGPLFPGKTHKCAIEAFAAFLVQFLGGPSEDTQRRWWVSLRESHLRFKIGQDRRDAWMQNMCKALDETTIEEPVRRALREFFEKSSSYLINDRGPDPQVCAGRPRPMPLDSELADRWQSQLRLDDAVAAIRARDTARTMELAETCTTPNRSVYAALLALMIATDASDLLAYAREKLLADPALATERYGGRTLLHAAAAAGTVPLLDLLLRLGADPNTPDDGGHTPIYSVANEYQAPGGGDVVHALAKAGADMDAHRGGQRCTALHMAARRDNTDVAAALLDCGADIEARDRLGETPLRRAVNCNQTKVAALLLSRGADRHSLGSKRLTPQSAARTSAMKQIFESGM